MSSSPRALALLAVALAAPEAVTQQHPHPWLGPELWANRLQDWGRDGDAIVCRAPELPWRTAHWLTRAVSAGPAGRATLAVHCAIEGEPGAGPAVGFWVGAGAGDLDPRAAALVQAAPGPDGGFLAGLDAHGHAFVLDMRDANARIPPLPPDGLLPRTGWTVVSTNGTEPDAPATNVLDGDPATIWHTPWRQQNPDHPHEIVLDMGLRHTIGGLWYLPRQDQPSPRVKGWALFGKETADEPWGQPVAEGEFADGPADRVVEFVPVTARYLRFVTRSSHGDRPVAAIAELGVLPPGGAGARPDAFDLEASIAAVDDAHCRLTLVARGADGAELARAVRDDVPPAALAGSIALACGGGPGAVRFTGWTAKGERIEQHDDRAFGPIAGIQYTLGGGVLKLTAQLLPLGDGELDGPVRLSVKDGKEWRDVGTAELERPGWTATFRVEGFAPEQDTPCKVACTLANGDVHAFDGTIRREPDGRRPLVLAAFTGNSEVRGGFGRPGFPWNASAIWFPHADLVAHVEAIDPDVLFFSGDQIYEGANPTMADRRGDGVAELDWLYKWLLWVWAFRDVTKDRPTITLPDDHDVYQGNLWGAGGRHAEHDHDGGYVMPAEFVQMVERAETSHLPDAFDPTPIEQGIGVHYGRWVYGGVDFAILEDRKFKSGPNGLVPPTSSGRPDHVVDPDFDPKDADVEGAKLLGDRQLAFLEQWASDWSGGARIKAAVSGTVFAGLATHHGREQQKLVADYDSNGWPQHGRNRALRVLREGFAFLIGGDQHLGTLAHMGVDGWRDASWSFGVPSIANFYPRAWRPETAGAGRAPGQPAWAGDHEDGFGNRVSVWAVTNPDGPTGREPAALHDGMPGFGVVRFDTRARTITVECWPRAVDPSAAGAEDTPAGRRRSTSSTTPDRPARGSRSCASRGSPRCR